MLKQNCLLLIIIFNLTNLPVFAQKQLTVNEMREDIDYYFNAIKEMHPHPYAKYTESQLDSVKLQLYKDCSQPMNLFDFNFLLAKTSKYTDGHTGIVSNKYLFNYSLKESEDLFPHVNILNNNLILNGNIINSINGISSTTILKYLDSMVSWEHTSRYRERMMSSYMTPLLRKIININSPYLCTIQNINTKTIKDSIVPSVNSKDWKNGIIKYDHHHAIIDSIFFKNDSIAVLFYNTSNLLKNDILKENIEKFTYGFFTQVSASNIKYLFIDVSFNGGGADLAHNYLFKYLKMKPYNSSVYITSTKKGAQLSYDQCYKLINKINGPSTLTEKNKKQIKKQNKIIKDFFGELIKKEKRKISIHFKGSKKGFNGTVFVIMGDNTFSAGHDFCETIKRSKAAILVGEESGQRFPFCGNVVYDNLPNSRIEFSIPTTFDWTEPALPNKDGFLQPDIPYNLSKPLELNDYKKIIHLSNKLNFEY